MSNNNMQPLKEETPKIPLEQVPLDNLTTTVNVLYSYLDRANKRGAFGLQESAKVMQCMALVGSVAKAVDEKEEAAEGETSSELEETVKPVEPKQSEPKKTKDTKPKGVPQQQGVRKKS